MIHIIVPSRAKTNQKNNDRKEEKSIHFKGEAIA
jgi:hypothetical protein